tara:strand:- start:194 stop:331 length:138 start_codon:yes stop_codon:yes gene_type:complete
VSKEYRMKASGINIITAKNKPTAFARSDDQKEKRKPNIGKRNKRG